MPQCTRCGATEHVYWVEVAKLGWRCGDCEAAWWAALSAWKGCVGQGQGKKKAKRDKSGADDGDGAQKELL